MSKHKYAVGVDFGTESGRAVLVDVASGKEVATSVYRYRNGVIDEFLPVPGKPVCLEPDWALQDPEDYIRTFQRAVPALLRQTGIDKSRVSRICRELTRWWKRFGTDRWKGRIPSSGWMRST